MNVIKQPSTIICGHDSIKNYNFLNNPLIITSKNAVSRGWIDLLGCSNYHLFDKVESNPSIETINQILSTFSESSFDYVIGIGGGSSLDVAKYVSHKLKKFFILIPTTFGSGSEVTRISVLKVDGKKQSFHDDKMIANVAIVDPVFLKNTPMEILKNSAIDACAQCTEAFDSKNGNIYTKFLCSKAFDILEDALLTENYDRLPLGSLLTGLGFGNSSTTLGHALSYVYSNEGYSHGHALAYTTTFAHNFNKSIFYERFLQIIKKLDIPPISLKQNSFDAAQIIFKDKKHLDNNPIKVHQDDLVNLLEKINGTDKFT